MIQYVPAMFQSVPICSNMLPMPPNCWIACVKSGEAVHTIHISGLRWEKETEDAVRDLFTPDVLSYVANKSSGFQQAFAYYNDESDVESMLALNNQLWPHDSNWKVQCRRAKNELDTTKVKATEGHQ